jgi:hypothetical protein
VQKLVEEYASPNIGIALGLQGELMVLEGLSKLEFVVKGRDSRSFEGLTWTESQHDLDFIVMRDGVGYGVEVKNTLGYMDHEELKTKLEMCKFLGLRPLFVVRMFPRSWIHEVNQSGGFVLVLKWQLYPWTHRSLAVRVRTELGLPVDCPRSLADGTMQRFGNWHVKTVI